MATATVTVTDVPEQHRFEAQVDGEPAGFVDYRLGENVIVFIHTEVDDAFEGAGVGSQLAAAALDAARERGLKVVPQCPFIRSYIERHPEYEALVAEA
jgi:uncharacterized protein